MKSEPEQEAGGALAQLLVAQAYNAGLALLARREHSVQELRRKLLARGFERACAELVLQRLIDDNLLSNPRFAESYARFRAGKGFGPLLIRLELQERGIERALIADCLDSCDADWDERARLARCKRFGAAQPVDYAERARQGRFLQQRGFTSDQISAACALKDDD